MRLPNRRKSERADAQTTPARAPEKESEMIKLFTGSWRLPPRGLGKKLFGEDRDFRDANAACAQSFDKAPRELEREGAREALPAPPLPIDDPEVKSKIRSFTDLDPKAFVARTGLAVSQIKAMSEKQIRDFLERLVRFEGESKWQ